MFKIFWILILCSSGLLRTSALAQKQIPLKVSLEMNTNKVLEFDDLNIKIIFTNINSTKPILLLQGFLYGFSALDSIREPDVFVQLEKLKKSKFLRQENRIENHGIRGYAMNYDTLELNKTLFRSFTLGAYYKFTKGEYRVRVIYNIPKDAELKKGCVYSEWLYFKVLSTIN